jgi:hypothetical protein
MRSYSYLKRSTVRKYLPLMKMFNVSPTARKTGFTKMYLEGKDPKKIKASKNQTWHEKRHNFLKRHLAQGHPLFKNGELTRYHLSLIAWGYSPNQRIRQ